MFLFLQQTNKKRNNNPNRFPKPPPSRGRGMTVRTDNG